MTIPEEGFRCECTSAKVIATVLYTAKILRLSEDVSMVVDIVKGREKVGSFCPSWDGRSRTNW
jgi:PII-like signaling protein